MTEPLDPYGMPRATARDRRVAVIAGAGPAGLTAAYELLRRTDVHPIVLEASDAIGGIARTYEYRGNRIDIGGHRFFSKSRRVMEWWFNILPLQGAPARDERAKGIVVDYAKEAVQRPLRAPSGNGHGASDAVVRRPAPDPELEDEVMLQRPRLSRIFYRRQFFPYPIGITFGVALPPRPRSTPPSSASATSRRGCCRSATRSSSTRSSSTASAAASTRPSSASTRRRSGASRAPRSRPTGAPSASRASP